jgi:hypothetical protein
MFGAKLLYLLNLHQCFLIFIIKDTHLQPSLLNPLRDIIEKITKQYISFLLNAASAISSLKYFDCGSCRICKSSARSRCYLAQVSWRIPTHNIECISCLEALIRIGNIVFNQPYDGICSCCTRAGKNRWSTGFFLVYISS